jgi:putative peptide maturation system protein
MHPELQPLLGETLNYLQTLARDGVAPVEARAGLRQLEQQYPQTPLELVWVTESYDQSVHYDALVHLPGEGTVSVSFSPERSLPWPLRGVQRWHDQDLVRVNGTVLTVDHAIACLDFMWSEAPIVRRLIDVCIIREALDREPIPLSDLELQRAMDAFRRARRLYTTEDTLRWMTEKGITREKLERLVADEATVAKLRERVAGDRVDAYFAAHAEDFGSVALLRLDFARPQRAFQVFEQLQQGTSFDDVARALLLEETPPPVLSSAVLHRHEALVLEVLPGAGSIRAGSCPIDRQAPPDLVTALFGAGDGDVLGPIREDKGGAALLRVIGVTPPRLNDSTRDAIRRRLFEDWLDQRRRSADIEWYWGNATQSQSHE